MKANPVTIPESQSSLKLTKTKKRSAWITGRLRAIAEGSGLKIILNKALECFFDSLRNQTTKTNYKKAFEAMSLNDLLVVESSLDDFKGNYLAIIEKIKSCSFKKGKSRSIRTALSSFTSYLNSELEGGIDRGDDLIDKDRKEYEEKLVPLSIEEWEKFIASLRQLNQRDAMIAELLQLANGSVFAWLSDEFLEEIKRKRQQSYKDLKLSCLKKRRRDKPAKGTPLVSLKMILEMPIEYVSFDEKWLRFDRDYLGGIVAQCYPFPSHIFTELEKIMRPNTEFVFTTIEGAPVAENQLKRSCKRASEKAKLSKHVSPKMIRIPIPELVYCPYCEKPRWNGECYC